MSYKKRKDFLNMVVNIILILTFVLVVYWFIQILIRGTLELSEFNFALIVMVAGLIFKLMMFVSNFNREFGEFKIRTIHSFDKIKQDMGLIKDDVGSIKQDVSLIKKKLGVKG